MPRQGPVVRTVKEVLDLYLQEHQRTSKLSQDWRFGTFAFVAFFFLSALISLPLKIDTALLSGSICSAVGLLSAYFSTKKYLKWRKKSWANSYLRMFNKYLEDNELTQSFAFEHEEALASAIMWNDGFIKLQSTTFNQVATLAAAERKIQTLVRIDGLIREGLNGLSSLLFHRKQESGRDDFPIFEQLTKLYFPSEKK